MHSHCDCVSLTRSRRFDISSAQHLTLTQQHSKHNTHCDHSHYTAHIAITHITQHKLQSLTLHNTNCSHSHYTTQTHTHSAFTEMAATRPDVWIHCGTMKSGVYGLKLLNTLGFRPKATLQVRPCALTAHSLFLLLSISGATSLLLCPLLSLFIYPSLFATTSLCIYQTSSPSFLLDVSHLFVPMFLCYDNKYL